MGCIFVLWEIREGEHRNRMRGPNLWGRGRKGKEKSDAGSEHMMDVLNVVNLVLTVGGIVGGLLAYRGGMARTANEIQERVIAALESELTGMRARLEDMKAENTRLSLIIDTICVALRRRGIAVSIDGDMVSISDDHGASTTTRIQEEQVL
ncbi:hypothetical protein KDAU_47020 [Dictyobacter aurantiacus]|uniref:Uncharacterized protein n=2 Tax=Dictyobacter aurantiacus TaxID=1936993 RepID=A0A401ZKJ9_9CHLR|nr:hypothetical protein KDAU_47020 [Dictyobacter aurantiacus]